MSSSSLSSSNHDTSKVSAKMGLQGPRPSPLSLKVLSTSKKIIKNHQQQLQQPTCSYSHDYPPRRRINNGLIHRRPVVIQLNSPEIIQTKPQDFMLLVQNLTGYNPTVASSSSSSSSYTTTRAHENNISGEPSGLRSVMTAAAVQDDQQHHRGSCSDQFKIYKSDDLDDSHVQEDLMLLSNLNTPSPGFFTFLYGN